MEWIIVVAISVSVLVIAMVIALPNIIKAKINKTLSVQQKFTGKVDGVTVSLLNSKITLYDLMLYKPSAVDDDLLVELYAPLTTCTFQWSTLLKKQVDLNIIVDQPNVKIENHSVAKSDNTTQSEPKVLSLKEPLSSLMAFTVNLKINNGTVNFSKTGDLDFEMDITDLEVSVDHFSNLETSQPCAIAVKGSLFEGNAEIASTLYPLATALQLDTDLKIRSVNIVLLNDLFRRFAKIDLSRGTLEVYSEIMIKDNMFNGYITPVLKDLDFRGAEDRNDTIFRRIWERIVAAGVKLLQNNKADQLASRIPIGGRLDDPKINIAAMIGGILKNAFIKPLRPRLKNVVDVAGFMNIARKRSRSLFQRLFATRQSNSV